MISVLKKGYTYQVKGSNIVTASSNQTSSNKTNSNKTNGRVLVVDENLYSRLNLVDILRLANYEVMEADCHTDIVNFVEKNNLDLILLELSLPNQDTLSICRKLKSSAATQMIPIIFMTVDHRKTQSRIKCLEAGAEDILVKPIERWDLITKVKNLIQQKSLNENLYETEKVLFRIAQAIDNPNLDNSKSEIKLAYLAKAFGTYLDLNQHQIKSLVYAAYLHDIGTVAVPEEILLKKGKLTDSEKSIIAQHVLIGEKICQPLENRLDILPIIRHHHEKWDGSGYPDGLIGEDIPWLAQVFQIIDIYDAITSERSYKQALDPQEALCIIEKEAEKGWRNPYLVGKLKEFILKDM